MDLNKFLQSGGGVPPSMAADIEFNGISDVADQGTNVKAITLWDPHLGCPLGKTNYTLLSTSSHTLSLSSSFVQSPRLARALCLGLQANTSSPPFPANPTNSLRSITTGLESLSAYQYNRTNFVGSFSPTPSNLRLGSNVSPAAISPVLNCRFYSSFFGGKGDKARDTEVSAVSGGGEPAVGESGSGGSDIVDMAKDTWKLTVEAITYVGERAKEASNEVTPRVQQVLESHPYLREVIVPVSGTLTGTVLAWVVLPRILRRLHKYSTQGPAALLSGTTLWGPVPYEKSFWGALEDPLRYLITFMAFSQIAVMVAPTTVASQYIGPVWMGAVIVSFVWFLHRWKSNVIARALEARNIEIDRAKLLTLDKVSSVGLFVLGAMALAEACGVAVQSILTVGGIGGVATAFAARDILGNILSGLSVQISQPFSIGDTIKAGSVEGQVVEMGLTTTSLLSAEKFPTMVPNSMFSSQVGMLSFTLIISGDENGKKKESKLGIYKDGLSSKATVFTFAGASRSDSSEAVADLFSGRGAEASLPYSLGWARWSSEGLNWRDPTDVAGNGKMGFSRQLDVAGAPSDTPGDALIRVIVNKSRARWRAMVTRIPFRTEDVEKVPLISEGIKAMLRSNPKVFLEKEPPYCFLSRIEQSFAELTLGCNLKQMSKDELFSTEQDILLQSVQIIKQHGARLGSTMDMTSQ
ncbi:hypothetical protein RHGRI_001713 [Rhododendron griersonianum]|uniref:Mechanosensitive ion channel MscS domain-containing protein n=1 Tax=Rhododendron griersonianum TaxID=479676 RepID=A0AAV6LQ53_9ERIC|nr:hypothetical protein RHGRI_001713 [Rhododendron griersonianum]